MNRKYDITVSHLHCIFVMRVIENYCASVGSFRNMFVAGEHCDIETSHWTHEAFGRRPVLDNWWQTETGWAITCTNVGLGNKLDPPHGATGVPVPGWNGMYSYRN